MPARNTTNKSHDRLRIIGFIVGSLVLVTASTIASQFAIGFIMLLILGPETFDRPVWTAVYSALSYVLSMVLILTIPHLFSRIRTNTNAVDKKIPQSNSARNELGLRGLPTWTDIGLAPVGYFVYILLTSLLMSGFSLLPWFNANETQNVGFNIYIGGLDRIVAFFTLVVIAPIAEEVIFRGWLYGRLRAKLNSKVSNTLSAVIATVLVSSLFGLLHFQWNVGVDVFALSVVLCTLREITGTTYAGILVHMLKNGIAFYLLYIIGIS